MKKLLCIILSLICLCFFVGCDHDGDNNQNGPDYFIQVAILNEPIDSNANDQYVSAVDYHQGAPVYTLSLQANYYVLHASQVSNYRPGPVVGNVYSFESDAIRIEEYKLDNGDVINKCYLYPLKECEMVKVTAKSFGATRIFYITVVDQPQIYVDAEVYNKVKTTEQDALTENDRLYNSFVNQGLTLNLSLNEPYYLVRVQYKDDCEASIINVSELDLQFDSQAMCLEIVDYIGERFLFLKGNKACQDSPITISYQNESGDTYTTTFNVSFN